MPNLRQWFKSANKEINFVFFVNSEKTHHFKLNYLFFKCLASVYIITTIIAILTTIAAFHALKEKKYLSEYVLNLKNFYIHNYLETRFSAGTQDEINEESNTDTKHKVLASAPKIDLPAPQELAFQKDSTSPIIKLNAYGILVDKEKVSIKNNKVHLSFLLLSSDKSKRKTIAGAVCAQLEGLDALDQKISLNYPESLKFDPQGSLISTSCLAGEHVKFSRLRPATFAFGINSGVFKPQKALFYFLEKNSKNAVLIKEMIFN